MIPAPRIALTVDLEDAHHGIGVTAGPSSFEADVDWILEQFAGLGARGTFFVLGQILDRYPGTVERIAAEGHEIAFHGATHEFLAKVGPRAFEAGLASFVPRLEQLAGSKVRGFRAPYFSLVPSTQWCLEILARRGLLYDASIYPGLNDRYGWPGAPVTPVLHQPTGLRLFPVPMLHWRTPIAFSGGAYLRILPWRSVAWGISRQAALMQPSMIYFHPWEIADALPWRRDASFRANVTRHVLRRRMRARLHRLLSTVAPELGRMDDVLRHLRDLPAWSPRATVA